jgi:hypothetical protein
MDSNIEKLKSKRLKLQEDIKISTYERNAKNTYSSRIESF